MSSSAKAVRISATLPAELAAFLDDYQRQHASNSRSAALAEAARVLREQVLYEAYRELGDAQRAGLEAYPPDNTDGLKKSAEA
ncbi:CopG family ribbon-helix-helix protein [Deinococcus sp.]|uniref:CopG family ribbon-helix-helix protein n=1 Tax=Deinococcus sp. TaxID=47478 RepID=UPI003B5AA93C